MNNDIKNDEQTKNETIVSNDFFLSRDQDSSLTTFDIIVILAMIVLIGVMTIAYG